MDKVSPNATNDTAKKIKILSVPSGFVVKTVFIKNHHMRATIIIIEYKNFGMSKFYHSARIQL